MGKTGQALRRLVCLPIVLYRLIVKPILGPCCRFTPSCSEYALDAISCHGVFRGIKLTCCRLLRCHPLAQGGYDPVLPNKEK